MMRKMPKIMRIYACYYANEGSVIPICVIDLSSVIKIDAPNKWASACVQPAIADG